MLLFCLILSFIISLDIAYPFLYHMEKDEAFTTAFPDPADHIDLHSLRARCVKGHYKSDTGDTGDGEGSTAAAVRALFIDLYRMVRNGKQYNNHNAEFQVWRLCDMFEKALDRLQRALPGVSEDERFAGRESSPNQCRLMAAAESAVTPVNKSAVGTSMDVDDMWNECEEV